MSRLWKVRYTIEMEMPVYAATQDEALDVAERFWRDDMAHCDPEPEFSAPFPISIRSEFPADWTGTFAWAMDKVRRNVDALVATPSEPK